jgi:hypothetical protein
LPQQDDQQGVQDRQGSLFFIVVQAFFGAVMGVLTVFGEWESTARACGYVHMVTS